MKLNKEKQKQTEAAESSGFDPLPDGAYHVKLRDVDGSRTGPSGPYWSWEFEVIDDREVEIETQDGKKKKIKTKGRRLWNNTSLSEKAAFKMKETFEAFDAGVDTDTDELIGKIVKAVVTTRVIQEGNRRGEMTNDIARLRKADADVLEAFNKEAKDLKEMADIF